MKRDETSHKDFSKKKEKKERKLMQEQIDLDNIQIHLKQCIAAVAATATTKQERGKC